MNNGIWCNKLLVSEALPWPAIVGWSATSERKLSKLFLKVFTSLESMFLILAGSKLNILAPFTPIDDSLALLTREEEDWMITFGRAVLPLRP